MSVPAASVSAEVERVLAVLIVKLAEALKFGVPSAWVTVFAVTALAIVT